MKTSKLYNQRKWIHATLPDRNGDNEYKLSVNSTSANITYTF